MDHTDFAHELSFKFFTFRGRARRRSERVYDLEKAAAESVQVYKV
jgi:hypothetical protein